MRSREIYIIFMHMMYDQFPTEVQGILIEKDLTISELTEKYEEAKNHIAELKRLIEGNKSERFIPTVQGEQINIFGEVREKEEEKKEEDQAEEDSGKVKKRKARKDGGRKKLPEHLPVQEQRLLPDIDVSEMKEVGTVITEKLEIVPSKLYKLRIIRVKFVDKQGRFHIAALPADPFSKFVAGTSLASDIIVGKYVDHLPGYRQHKIFKRQGVHLPESTINDLIRKGYLLLKVLYTSLERKILLSDYLQVDESSIPVLRKDNPGKAKKECMMVMVDPVENLCLFKYVGNKKKENLLNHLKGFKGYLQVDGNVSYEDMRNVSEVELLHCMAHSRRYFEKALDYDEKRSSHFLTEIQKVYAIERQLKEAQASVEEKRQIRQEKTAPILKDLKSWMDAEILKVVKSTPIYRALGYAIKRWNGLTVFLTDGKLRIDNNLIENQIRPLALGRKNFMFAASINGAKYAAVFYSFFCMCQMNGHNHFEWLQDFFLRVEDHSIDKIEELLPTKNYQYKYIIPSK